VEVFDPASTRVFIFSRILSAISLPEVGSGVPNKRHRVQQLISLLSWLLRPLVRNRSSTVDLGTLTMCLAKPRPQIVRLQLSDVTKQFYMQDASVWRHALISCPLVIVVLHVWESTGKWSR
jgi:hypothetical protein